MYFKRITTKTRNISEIINLYNSSFPENERRNFQELIDENSKGMEFLAFYENDVFIGFITILNCKNISHIIYFAVHENLRGQGYGSKILNIIKEIKLSQKILADLEKINFSKENNNQRIKRENFYIKNGFQKTNIYYIWNDETYNIFSNTPNLSEKEYNDFWNYFDVEVKK